MYDVHVYVNKVRERERERGGEKGEERGRRESEERERERGVNVVYITVHEYNAKLMKM